MLTGAICVVTGLIVVFRGVSSDWNRDLVRSSIALGAVFFLAGVFTQSELSSNPIALVEMGAVLAVSLFYLVRSADYSLFASGSIGFGR